MKRSLLLLILLSAASCKRGGSKPPAAGSGSGSALESGSASAAGSGSGSAAVEPPSTGIAKPLQGPFATIEAYCATRPTGNEHTCDAADVKPTGTLPAGLLEMMAVYESSEDASEDISCSVALRTSAGWFVGPPSAEMCRQPSYIDFETIEIETAEAIATITLGINWHTNHGDEEAPYKLTALCGVGRGGVPASTPVFLSQCDKGATPCTDGAFELTWTLDGNSATFKPSRQIDSDGIPTGTQTIL